MFLASPPRYYAPPVRQYTLVATMPLGRPSRMRYDGYRGDARPYVIRFEPGAFADVLGVVAVHINHVGSTVGRGTLTATTSELRLQLDLDADNDRHQQLVANPAVLRGLSVGSRHEISRVVPAADGANMHVVTRVVSVSEVSIIVAPEWPTCFSSCDLQKR